jgi:hypothetical protein
MKILAIVITLLSTTLLEQSRIEAEEAEPIPKVVFSPITQEQLDLFLDSVRTANPLDIPPPRKNDSVDPNLAGFWAGSKVEVFSDIRQITLRFRRRIDELLAASKTNDYDTNTLLEAFDIIVDPSERWLTVTHSHQVDKQRSDGLRVRIDRPARESVSPFLKGQGESSAYFVIPPFKDGASLWGMFVCPRRMVQARLPGGLSGVVLSSSPYELSEVKFELQARADAVMSTAGQDGEAKAELKVSKNLPESTFSTDTSISTVPKVSVHFKPATPIDFFRFAPYKEVQEGVQLSLALTNKAGYRRTQQVSHALYIQKFIEPPPITIVADRKRVVSDEGDCYVLMDFAYRWVEYSKETSGKPLSGG